MITHWPQACAAMICSAAVTLAAQSSSPQPQAAPGNQRFVAIGCVSRTAPAAAAGGAAKGSTFILTDMRGEKPNPPLRYRLDGDAATLGLHVGHTVEVAGPLRAPAGTAAGEAGAPTLKVDALTYISNSCSRPPSP